MYLIRHFTLHFLTTPVNTLELGNWIAYLDPGVMVHTCSSPVGEVLGSGAERLIIAACAERWESLLIILGSFASLPFRLGLRGHGPRLRLSLFRLIIPIIPQLNCP